MCIRDRFCPIVLSDNITRVKKVVALSECTILLCMTSPNNKAELYSFGADCAALGQDKQLSDQYARLAYSEDIEFKDVVGYGKTAAGITTVGELYVWGSLEKFGSLETAKEEAGKLLKVKLPDNNVALSVSIGEEHMLILTESRTTKKRLVLGFGANSYNQLGVNDVGATKSVLTFFEDRYPYLIAAGYKCSFVACGKKGKAVSYTHLTLPTNREV
eukprot:TRINITY_DN16842_c0_g1_i1.p1 TRINITY_DN16842_c0_g1~~TRINITY_DN16842_c0_g1_i1.p1  ORF type:complete len:216 (+),score=40.61 TRINITY_DN16842_c0_g1_i1:73-720(+)